MAHRECKSHSPIEREIYTNVRFKFGDSRTLAFELPGKREGEEKAKGEREDCCPRWQHFCLGEREERRKAG